MAAVQDLTLDQAPGTCGVGGVSLYPTGFVGVWSPQVMWNKALLLAAGLVPAEHSGQ